MAEIKREEYFKELKKGNIIISEYVAGNVAKVFIKKKDGSFGCEETITII